MNFHISFFQLPTSCIARAVAMAAKLEADVSARVGNRVQKLILDSLAQHKALRNCSSHSSSLLVKDRQFEDLTKSFHQVNLLC